MTASRADADELADGRVDEERRVVVAVPAAGAVDEHDVVAAELRLPAAPLELARESARSRAPRSFLTAGGDRVGAARSRAGPRRVREDVHLRDPGALDRAQRARERGLVLGREADDHVGRQVELAGERLEPAQVGRGRVAAAHRAQDAVVARLERDVEVPRGGRRLAQRRDELRRSRG